MLFKEEISEEIKRISNIYTTDISKIPFLGKKEQESLFLAWKRYGNIDARNKLIISNLRLVVRIALYHYKKTFPLPELIAVGNTGLIDAVYKFDTERGTKFSSFAYERIAGKIKRYVKIRSEEIKTPENKIDLRNERRKEKEILFKKEGIDLFEDDIYTRIIDDIEDNSEEYHKKDYEELYNNIRKLNDNDQYIIIKFFGIKMKKPRVDFRELGNEDKQKKRVKEILQILESKF